MKIPVMIDVKDNETDCCGENCPFLTPESTCTMFNAELEKKTLPKGFKWADGYDAPIKRFWQCVGLDP